MLPKVANHLIHHTSRAVIAVQNQTGHTLRNVLQLQSSSGPTTAVTGWGSSVSGGGPHSGPGPSKFHTSSRLHTTPTGPPLSASQVRERVEKLSAFRASSSPRSQNVIADPSSDPSQLVRSGFGTYATLISTLTDRDFENYEAVRRAEARLRRRRRAAIGESAEEEEQRIADLRGDSHFASAFALFQTAAVNPNSKFPLHIYNKLLRSCAIHSNAHAAQAVYAHLEKRSDIHPDAQTFISLIATYAGSKDVQGAEKTFEKFRDASRLERVQWSFDAMRPNASAHTSQRASQMAVWNEMLTAYFRCGQPSDALALLEQMMDSTAGDATKATDVPPPSPATFSCAISGFCHLGDVSTALTWFERMLQQQDSASADPYEPTLVPRRPDQATWTAMFDALADEGMVAELNRLFARWLDVAPSDGTVILSDHRDTVLAANLRFMDTRADLLPAKALELLDFLSGHVLPWNVDSVHFTFNREISRTLSERLVMQYWNRGHTDRAIELAERIASRQLQVLQYGQSQEAFDSSKTQSRIEGARRFVTDLVTDILGSNTSGISLTHLLRLSGLLADVGALHSAAFSEACLNAYALQRNNPTLALSTREWEALLDVILSGDADATASLNTLVDDLLQHSVDVSKFSEHAKGQLVRSLSSSDLNSVRLLAQLGEPFATRLAELEHAQRSPSVVSAQSFETPSSWDATPVTPVSPVSGRIDSAHSHFVGEFFPGGNKTAVLSAYERFKDGAERGIYPRSIVAARLISALGRLGEVEKIQEVYCTAHEVLASLENPKHWQTSGWFLIEDHMIIGLAHAGDVEAAHVHRQRILQHGGVPSADAYGALILNVKDTTDDTSNAMALYQESQTYGVTPNIFMYNTIISKLAKARKADFALQLFQDMKARNVHPTSVTYGAVIAACCRVGDAASAELLFQEMISEPTFKPRVPPYNTMMQLYTHTKPDRERVLHYYNALREANVQPTAHTYKLLIDAYGCIEPIDLPAMQKVFEELVADRNVSVQGTHWAALINAWGCVQKDLDQALKIFDSIATHPTTNPHGPPMPDAVVYEALVNTLVTVRRMDLVPMYLDRLRASGVHMTAYIANLLIKGYASVGEIERAREIFESLQDPQEGVAAPHNHLPHQNKPQAANSVPADAPVFREPSTWEAMVRAELGIGERERAVALLQRLQARMFPPAVYQRISGIMLDESVSPWAATDAPSSSL
ncbi:hypothetical protein PYCCODRAFT_1368445 [Trametes coccinea BRFM310]|uniref:Pentacotripeptide-repeat region of PRORP domain-containing protein n=1 Tax=Trametes coccinea (strain BRFM310) TaxID=1353009 RepID=A0A1Y2ILI6_TRAC3|nr:hypothetical protein PYCCODRAFT_1368445 [Trametes coccinea BRFM310]